MTQIKNYKTNKETPSEWLEKRNPLLISFLSGCTGSHTGKRTLALVHTVENVLYARNLNTITPFSFERNLLLYCSTKDKLSVNLAGVWGPSGSYSTVHGYTQEPAEPLQCPPGPVDTAIDNNQKVAKSSGHIREASKVPVEICTAVSHICCKQDDHDDSENIQHNPDFKPSKWLKPPDARIVQLMDQAEEQSLQLFRQYRHTFIQSQLEAEKQKSKDYNGRDFVDVSIIHQQQQNVCSQCSHVYPNSTEQCPNCRHDPSQYDSDYDPYHIVPSGHPQKKPVSNLGEPIMVNPNSETNVQKVYDELKRNCEIGSGIGREWITVSSDGVPYLQCLQNSQWQFYVNNLAFDVAISCQVCGQV